VIYGLILVLHLLICVVLILVVLLQSGKGGGLAGAFGGMGGAGQTLFGGRGAATFLSKATTVLGIAFMASSLMLALMAGSHGGPHSVIRAGENEISTEAPPVSTQPLQIPGDAGLPTPNETQTAPVQIPSGGASAPAGGAPATPPQNPAPSTPPAGNAGGGGQ
jgi:preprotein translocase subunit SecG